ncbi:MAG: MBL fold metallo-hydrolase, partial [Acidobacteriaceae bacterium]|nr:MBL fold metallo-hydrolase [Acidobacteriaceae bacterium]
MRRSTTIATVATIAVSVLAGSAEERFTTKNNNAIVVHPLVHASVRLDIGTTIVYVDPWSRADLADAPPADLILITDADAGAHHLDVSAINTLRKNSTTIVIPASGKQKLPDGIVLANGNARDFGTLHVESVSAYDILPGEPFHARGVANAYLLTVDGLRILFAGVTECVPEIKALRNIDIAFLPMNLPNGRMTVEATAACINELKPKVVYPYHYDQGYIARLSGRG